MSHRFYLAIGVFCLAGCGRAFPTFPPGNGPQPTPGTRSDGSPDRAAAVSGLTLTPNSDVRHYLTNSTTVIQQTSDTVSNQAVIRMTLEFSLAYWRSSLTHTRITGTLSRMSATADRQQPDSVSDQLPGLPLEFTGRVVNGSFFIDSLESSPVGAVLNCQAPGLNGLAGMQRSIIVPPLLLSTGTTWTDSSTVPACSASIQLAVTTIRTYTVAGTTVKGPYPVIVIDRRDRVRTSGQGALGQHRISILSQGSGTARIYVDRTTGLLHSSEGTQAVDLVVGSSGRRQYFRQVSEERTDLQQ